MTIKYLPTNFKRFTVYGGTSSFSNTLKMAASSSSNYTLRNLKSDYLGKITAAFDNNFFKSKIRSGGLNDGERKLLLKHIFKNAPELRTDIKGRRAVMTIVNHFSLGSANNGEEETRKAATSTAELNSDKTKHSAGETNYSTSIKHEDAAVSISHVK